MDVFNPSGAAPKNNTPILAPTMPTMPAQQMNFFVPSPNQQQNVSAKLFNILPRPAGMVFHDGRWTVPSFELNLCI